MPEWARWAVATLGYWVVPLSIGIESLGIPLPAETLYLAASAFAAKGLLDIRFVVLLGALGAALGGQGGYFVGSRGGRQLLNRYGHAVGLTTRRVEFVERFFQRHGSKTVFIGRFQFVLRTYMSFIAGAVHMPVASFAPYNLAGAVAWAGFYGVLGYTLGANWDRLKLATLSLGIASAVLIAILAAAIVAAVLWRRRGAVR